MHTAGLVVNFHREQRLGMKTMRFVRAAMELLEQQGVALNCRFVLDRPDQFTRSGIKEFAAAIPRSEVLEVDFGNLGASRAAGLARVDDPIVFFLDGDDFVSFNWFGKAHAFLCSDGNAGKKLIAHTQFFVGFDKEQFVRLALDSRDPAFDPLALAADWFFCNNLACHRSVFDTVPIEPYDHASGFGAEDWHWSCETIARGFAHCFVPGTSYFYRCKPAKFSLGSAGELVPRKSMLFDPHWIGAHPSSKNTRAAADESLPALDSDFFSEADRLVPFDFGISYLRSLQAGTRNDRYFRPGVPDAVGESVRRFFAGIDEAEGVDIIHADLERLPGGISTIDRIVSKFAPGAGQKTNRRSFHIFEGRPREASVREITNAIWLDELRAAGTGEAQISRLIARFFIQSTDVRVFNFVSPRKQSLAAGLSTAKRHSITAWYNLILEYGLDHFSSTATEISAILSTGIPVQTVAIYRKTARELARETGVPILHASDLEEEYVLSRGDGGVEPGFAARAMTRGNGGDVPEFHLFHSTGTNELPPHLEMVDREFIRLRGNIQKPVTGSRYLYLILNESALSRETLSLMVNARPPGEPAVAIPALVVRRRNTGSVYLRPDLEHMNLKIACQSFPHELLQMPVLGFEMAGALAILEKRLRSKSRVRLARFLLEYLKLRGGGRKVKVVLIGQNAIATCDETDMRRLDHARVERDILRAEARWAGAG